MLSPRSEHVIGLDATSIIVNPVNPISTLTVEQVHGIFTGSISNWSELGGTSIPIKLVITRSKGGPFDTFDALVLDGAHLGSGAQFAQDGQAVSAAVAADAAAIGFTRVADVGRAKVLAISSAGTPFKPDRNTIGREDYPLSRRLYLYTGTSARSSPTAKFVAFVQSDAGQKIVNGDGFIGTVSSLVAPSGGQRIVPAGAPAAYANLIHNFEQASVTLYFNTGSYVLDNKALVDLGRIVQLLTSDRLRGHSVVLAGFADSVGDAASNLQLSRQRAEAAAIALKEEGVRVSDALGFGQDLPIRTNATAEGREKNRRVEIFFSR
jgi:phosphate transport system substrate-binding protein